MFFGLRDAYQVKVGALDRRQNSVREFQIGLIPRLFFEVILDRSLLENAAVLSENNAAKQREIIGIFVLF